MALAHVILLADNSVEVMKGAATGDTVGDTQSNHDNQLGRENDPFTQLGSCSMCVRQ